MTPQELSRLAKTLDDESRVMILDIIIRYGGTQCVLEIEDKLEQAGHALRQASISHHLRILRYAGLVDSRKHGLNVYYSVCREPLAKLSDALMGYVRMGSEVAV
jgi:ArsR family transcriptional regulator